MKPNKLLMKLETHPEIEKFIAALTAAGLLSDPGEGLVLAKNANRYRPDYGFMVDVVATRAAHKKFGPTN
jgi:hypothetical protein